MAAKWFNIVGLKAPGRVHLYQVGEVNLCDLPNEKLMEIYKQGNTTFLQPTEAGLKKLFPKQETISTKRISGSGTKKK